MLLRSAFAEMRRATADLDRIDPHPNQTGSKRRGTGTPRGGSTVVFGPVPYYIDSKTTVRNGPKGRQSTAGRLPSASPIDQISTPPTMPREGDKKRWLAMESNPVVMNAYCQSIGLDTSIFGSVRMHTHHTPLGERGPCVIDDPIPALSTSIYTHHPHRMLHSFQDVLSTEDWALEMVGQPVLAVLFLFPVKDWWVHVWVRKCSTHDGRPLTNVLLLHTPPPTQTTHTHTHTQLRGAPARGGGAHPEGGAGRERQPLLRQAGHRQRLRDDRAPARAGEQSGDAALRCVHNHYWK